MFGTIKVSPDRDVIIAALARQCGLPIDGPWELELEWSDPENHLNERRSHRTQVDVAAFGKRATLFIECKFTEGGGACSQTDRRADGTRQRNGNYAMQRNPANNILARCALTGKGIRYWDAIPRLFGLSVDDDHIPCPFRGDAYQWMRNAGLADMIAARRGVSTAVIAAYADADCFATAQKVRSGELLGRAGVEGHTLVSPISYQRLIDLAQENSALPDEWIALREWVARKICLVPARRSKLPTHDSEPD